jgi:hypothetical protein
MNLNDLFREAIGDLLPGEKRFRPEYNVKSLTKIYTRIEELQMALLHNEDLQRTLQRDPDMMSKLDSVKQKIQRKIQLLSKAKDRPSVGGDKLLQVLNQECSDFIEIMKKANSMLYRGVKSEESVFEGRSRDDRTPKDSNKAVSAMLDQMLDQLGVSALRGNSIYATSSYGQASGYGWHVYIIFPKNGFDFLATNQRDLILDRMDQLVDKDTLKSAVMAIDNWGQTHVKDWSKTSLAHSIKYSDWQEALRLLSDNFKWESNKLELPPEFDINIKSLITPKTVQKALEPNTTDLQSAIENRKEIMIKGEYWALKKSDWYELVNRSFLDGNSYN